MWPTTSMHGVNAVNFPQMTPEHWNAALQATVDAYKEAALTVARDPASATFDNTLGALEKAAVALNDTFGALMCAKSHATDEIQQLVTHWSPLLTEVSSEIMQNQAIYDRLRAAFEREGHQWTPEQTKLHEDTLWELKEAGCGRSDADKDTIRALKTDLSRLETEFEQINLKNANNTIALPAKHLADAPEGFLDQCAHHVIDGVDHLCVPVNAAYAEPLLEHLSHRPTRQRVWEAWTGRGTGALPNDTDTAPLMEQILRQRSALAQVLGYPSWADYMLARRMEKSPSNIAQMLQQMWDKLNAVAHDNVAELQQWAAGQGFDQPLQPWGICPITPAKRSSRKPFSPKALKSKIICLWSACAKRRLTQPHGCLACVLNATTAFPCTIPTWLRTRSLTTAARSGFCWWMISPAPPKSQVRG